MRKFILFSIIPMLMGSVCFAAGVCPVIHIDGAGKSGSEIGADLGAALLARFPDIEQKIDAHLHDFIRQVLFDEYARARLGAVRAGLERKYRDEIDAVGARLAGAGRDRLGDGRLSLNEFRFYQLVPDIVRATDCSGFGVFGGASATRGPVVGRNLDWETTEDLRGLQLITVYQYENREVVNVGFAGFLGVLTGFNDDGLFAAHMDSAMGRAYPDPPTGYRSAMFDIREALETAASISGAARLLSGRKHPFSHNILFADKKNVMVLEHPRGETAGLRTASSPLRRDISWGRPDQIAAVNFFASKGYSNGRDTFNLFRWRRFRTLARFNPRDPAHALDVERVMLDDADGPYQGIFNVETVQSMVFTPLDGTLRLYTAPVSGARDLDPVMVEVTGLTTASAQGSRQEDWLGPALFLAALLGGYAFYYAKRGRSER